MNAWPSVGQAGSPSPRPREWGTLQKGEWKKVGKPRKGGRLLEGCLSDMTGRDHLIHSSCDDLHKTFTNPGASVISHEEGSGLQGPTAF